uniref:Uncharacterized protein n=1 Tax=Piliocolobus tephrosceles TaxID=591936 RepID=A0A8C9IE68_9PRIM
SFLDVSQEDVSSISDEEDSDQFIDVERQGGESSEADAGDGNEDDGPQQKPPHPGGHHPPPPTGEPQNTGEPGGPPHHPPSPPPETTGMIPVYYPSKAPTAALLQLHCANESIEKLLILPCPGTHF